MRRERAAWPLMLASLLLAVLLALVPLPAEITALRPYWLALVVAYWALEAPENAGFGFAFAAGLLADVAHGAILGEQALRMVILVFLVDRFRNRLRFFPVWQQALVIGAMLFNDRVVAALIHAVAGLPQWPALYWLSPVSGLLLWGPVFLVLDGLRHRRGRG